MTDIVELALNTLATPVILSFVLGLAAALARSDLSVPEAFAKAMSLYLLFAIGFKGGVSLSAHGADATLAAAIVAGVVLSLGLPVLAFWLLSMLSRLGRTDRAAIAAHYGSISIVTFVAATTLLEGRGIEAEGYMVAVAAAMEAPAILSALWLVARDGGGGRADADLWREIMLNGSIVLLLGSFAIGMVTGQDGLDDIAPLVVAPFKGILCLFLLDMGLVAGRGLRQARGRIGAGVVAFGLLMPPIGAALGLALATLIGLGLGGSVLMMVLAASASYIAVPAAMRVALPEADPGIYLTLSLGITFPFNLTLGIPAYLAVAQFIQGVA